MSQIKSMGRWVGRLLLATALVHVSAAWAGNAGDGGNEGQRPPHGPPPQAAIDACSKVSEGAACSITGRRGETITGTCRIPPQQSALACVPAHPPVQQPMNDDGGSARGY